MTASNIGFKGIDVRMTSGGQLVFRVFLQDSSGNKITSGTTVITIYELQSDGTIKSYDFSDNTFKATALTTATLALTHRTGNNATTNTGIWTAALATLTGFTIGAIYEVQANNATASPPDQTREFQFGGAEGDLLVTSAFMMEGDLQTVKTQTVACAAGVTVGAFVGNASAAISVDGSGRVDIGKILGTASAGAAGSVGIDWSKVANPTSTVGLSGTTISTTQAVASVSGNVGGSVASISGITFPANFSVLAIAVTTGYVTVGTNNDKNGYALTQSFPSNFSSLGISSGGHILNVDTVTTYTGNTPQSGDAYSVVTNAGYGNANLASGIATTITDVLALGSPMQSGTHVQLATAQDQYAPAKAGNQMDFVSAPNATAITAIQSGIATATNLGTVLTRIGTPAASVSADIAAVKTDTGGIVSTLSGLVASVWSYVERTLTSGGGGGGSGDATLANQTIMIADLIAIQTALAVLTSSGLKFTYTSLLQPGGLMTVIPGDDYYTVDGRSAIWTPGGLWPNLTGATIANLVVYDPTPPNYTQLLTFPLSLDVPTQIPTQQVSVQLPNAQTTRLRAGDILSYALVFKLANGHNFTPVVGTNKFVVASGSGG